MPRFVILEHAWNGVHWDLMLEVDGALETWAVSEPLEPERELSARALARHRLAYLSYEGPISGGRGAVTRWDEGEYDLIVWCERQVHARLRGGRFSGEIVLSRTESGSGEAGGGESWILRTGKVD